MNLTGSTLGDSLALYNELNVFFLVILLILLIKIKTTNNKIKYHCYFVNTIYLGIILCIIDMIKMSIGYRERNLWCFIIYSIYYILLSTTGFSFFYYFGRLIHFNSIRSRKYKLLFAIPYGIALVMLILSDLSMHYFIITYSILYLITTIHVSGIMFKYVSVINRFYYDRAKFILFPLIPLITGIIHIIDYRIPLTSGITIACIIGYISSIDLLISTDSLTNINNRHNLSIYIDKKLKSAEKGNSKLYIMMIDADNFKGINDTYGHTEGDRCLIRLANVIKHSCNGLPKRAFMCRYGGDEFLIAAECTEEEMLRIEDRIHDDLNYRNAQDNCKYEFTVTIGIAEYDSKSHKNIEDFIKSADNILYVKKKIRKNKNTLRA